MAAGNGADAVRHDPAWSAGDGLGNATGGPTPSSDGPNHHNHRGAGRDHGWGLLVLSFSALGIIYGDIGTSPLYAYQAVFSSPPNAAYVLSAASLFFWTLTLIVLVKYVGIIIRFDDNGEGGTFALYSLVCRAAGFTAFGPAQPEELHLSGRLVGALPPWLKKGHWWSVTNAASEPLRRLYARSRTAQVALLVTVMTATAMVVGDGVLTPSISVLSAISGLKVAAPGIKQGEVIGVTIIVLVLLFSVQYLGTNKISAVFAPVVAVWLLFNAAIGLYNLSTCGWGVWQAISPHHAIAAFTGAEGFVAGWKLLAGVMLAITGAEAMYADLGHFNARAVRLSFCGLVYPCLIVTYMGQASFLTAHPDAYTDPFWLSVPKGAFWPMLIVATAATVVASQALISGVFSIMRQAMNLGVFPPMKVTHTDTATEGQIYIRQINFLLMLGCIAMVAGFQDTTALGHAYGVAVMSVMFMTTILAGIVMLVCYGANPLLVAAFLAFFVPLEGLFLSSNIIKIPEGGWVTIMIAAIVATINLIWWYGFAAKHKWYKVQAAKNQGLLAQLPAAVLAESSGGAADGADDDSRSATQPLLPSSHRTADEPPGRAAANGNAAPAAAAAAAVTACAAGITAGTTTNRRRGSGALPSSLQPAVSADLGPLSTGGAAQPGSGYILETASAEAEVGGGGRSKSKTGRRLLSKSYTTGGVASRQGEVMVFDNKPLARLPGLGIVYTQATTGLPAVLQHLLINMPALYDVTVLLTLRVITRPYVSQQERFLVRRSSSLSGVYRVIARYGYMEQIDQGPAFVKQLVTCLVRYVAHEQHQQQQAQPAAAGHRRSGTASSARSLGGGGGGGGAGAAAAAGAGGGAGADTVIQLPAAEAGQQAADKGLQRWSRVPMHPADGAMLDEVLVSSTGPNLAARSFSKALTLSPAASLGDLASLQPQPLLAQHSEPGAGATTAAAPGLLSVEMTMPEGAASPSGLSTCSVLLGRESINRRQYSLQYRAAGRRMSFGTQPHSPTGSTLVGAGSSGGSGPAHLITIPSSRAMDQPAEIAVTAAAPAGASAAGGGGGGGAGGADGVAAAPAGAGAAVSEETSTAAGSNAAAAGGNLVAAAAVAAPGMMTAEQLAEIELLLLCYRRRAVYIMGKSQLAAVAGASAAAKSGQEQQQRKGLAAAVAFCRAWFKGVVTGAYRLLANNTQPSSQSWQLPDDQLLLVAMVVRV